MPQVQVLPAVQSFGSKLASVLGQAGADVGQGFAERSKKTKITNLTQELQNPNITSMQKLGIVTKLTNLMGPQAAKAILPLYAPFIYGENGTPNNAPAPTGMPPETPQNYGVPNGISEPPTAGTQPTGVNNQPSPTGQMQDVEAQKKRLLSMVGLPYGIGDRAKAELDILTKKDEFSESQKLKKELQYLKINEPKLIEINDNQRSLVAQNKRFGRLEELFKDRSKFPSSIISAVFSKDGQLRPLAASLLSSEAQESIKLIQDELNGAKETFGSRVSNFEVGQYLKRLPSLLNNAEGRDRVLRDLRLLNSAAQFYNQKIGDIFEEHGGTDKIPFSKAEAIFKNKYQKELDAMSEEFINPTKSKFKDLPDASEPKYLGIKIRDKKTGEILISDGKEWKPVSR